MGIKLFTPEAKAPTIEEPKVEKLATPVKVVVPKKSYYKDPVSLEEKIQIANKIALAFPENKVTMVAIALDESGLNKNATGYNCYYKVVTKETGTYDKISGKYLDYSNTVKVRTEGYRSTYCRAGDQAKAWSKDGGLFQNNQPTAEDYDVDKNIENARRKYDTQGLSAWTVYNTGSYKKHLEKARELLALK